MVPYPDSASPDIPILPSNTAAIEGAIVPARAAQDADGAGRGRRRTRNMSTQDFRGLMVPKEDIGSRFATEVASIQWMCHLDEYNSYKAFSRSVTCALEQAYTSGRTDVTVDVNNREYTVHFGTMVQESMHTGRLRHVMRGFFPLRPKNGHPETGLPVEVDSGV